MLNRTGKRLLRSEVPEEMKWDLSDLFETRELWQQELATMDKVIESISTSCAEQLNQF